MVGNKAMGCHMVPPMVPPQEPTEHPQEPMEHRQEPTEHRQEPTEPQGATLLHRCILRRMACRARVPLPRWPTRPLQPLTVPQGSSRTKGPTRDRLHPNKHHQGAIQLRAMAQGASRSQGIILTSPLRS